MYIDNSNYKDFYMPSFKFYKKYIHKFDDANEYNLYCLEKDYENYVKIYPDVKISDKNYVSLDFIFKMIGSSYYKENIIKELTQNRLIINQSKSVLDFINTICYITKYSKNKLYIHNTNKNESMLALVDNVELINKNLIPNSINIIKDNINLTKVYNLSIEPFYFNYFENCVEHSLIEEIIFSKIKNYFMENFINYNLKLFLSEYGNKAELSANLIIEENFNKNIIIEDLLKKLNVFFSFFDKNSSYFIFKIISNYTNIKTLNILKFYNINEDIIDKLIFDIYIPSEKNICIKSDLIDKDNIKKIIVKLKRMKNAILTEFL